MNTDTRVFRWGILGCGNVTEVKSGPGFQKASGSALVAVMRRNGAAAQDYATRHGIPRWYDDAAALIADPEVDGVYIASPPGTHLELIRQVAQAGKPIYVEKPMTRSYTESQMAVEACAAAGVPLYVAYYRRALEKYQVVKQLLDQGDIGVVRLVNAVLQAPLIKGDKESLPWRVIPEHSGGGLIMDVGSHALDLLYYYFGPATRVQGLSTNKSGRYQPEDLVTGTWSHNNGVQATGAWLFDSHKEGDTITIYGTEGSLQFSVLDVAGPVVVERRNQAPESLRFPVPDHIQQPMIQELTRCLGEVPRGKSPLESPFLCPGIESLATDHMLEELRKNRM